MSYPTQSEPQFTDTIKDFVAFLRSPRLPEETETTDHFKVFMHLLGLSLMLSFGVMILVGLLREGGLIPEFPHAMKSMMKEQPFLLVLLWTTIAAPLVEELAFRLWLVYKPAYFFVSLWLISLFVYSVLRQQSPPAAYAVLAFAALATGLLLTFREASEAALEKVYQQQLGWIFYGATAIFALVHLFNFEFSFEVLLFSPALVLPQFLLGLVLGYLRIRQGILWAMALHGIYNGLILSLAYRGMQQTDPSTAAAYFFF